MTRENWFWQQGYHDGLDGLRAIAPDETRYSFQRSDYFAGYEAGSEDRRDALLESEPQNQAIDRCVEELQRECGSVWDVLGAVQKTDGEAMP